MKIFAIGMNYSDHVKEMAGRLDTDPVFFIKPDTSLLVNNKPFFYPDFSKDIQYETEIVIRISQNGKSIQPAFASRYYAELTVGIDFTARDIQLKCKEKGWPWEMAKGFDNAAAVGRFIPLNSIEDLQKLHFHLDLNGKTVQSGYTGHMILNVDDILVRLSEFFTIRQGDMVFTGTPAGVGSVHIGDRLQAYIEDQLLLDFNIL